MNEEGSLMPVHLLHLGGGKLNTNRKGAERNHTFLETSFLESQKKEERDELRKQGGDP